jgi:hypothetical protein
MKGAGAISDRVYKDLTTEKFSIEIRVLRTICTSVQQVELNEHI